MNDNDDKFVSKIVVSDFEIFFYLLFFLDFFSIIFIWN